MTYSTKWVLATGADQKTGPQEIVIKEAALDLSQLQEGKGIKYDFRPQTLDQYVGQESAKARILTYINGSKKFNDIFPHIFLSAPAGCGKSVFANIIANMLDKKFVKCSAVDLKTEQQLVNKIVECEGGTLFIDEFHKIGKLGTFLLTILEEFLVNGKRIRPFTLIVATTHKGNLSKDLSALVQRFLPIELEHYTSKELVQILVQFHKQSYPTQNVEARIYDEIVDNCKFTPRIALRFLKEFIYTESMEIVKQNNNIVKAGLTKTDIRVLKYLDTHNGCGKNSISKYLNIEPNTYEYEVEPFLIYKNFIEVSSRRKITNEGKKFLKEI